MRILMFGWEFPPKISGGLGTACYGMTKGLALSRATSSITVALPRLHGGEDQSYARLVELASEESTTVSTYASAYSPGLIGAVASYTQAARKLEGCFDVIHAHDWLTYQAGIEAKRRLNKPLVVHVHSTEVDRTRGAGDRRIEFIERCGMDGADRIIAVSDFTRQIIIDRYDQDGAKVVTVHNGVDSDPADTACRPALDAAPVVSFIGRLTSQKGPEYFLRSAERVLQHAPQTRFVMAGDGDLRSYLEQLAHWLGIDEQVSFPGFLGRDEVEQLLRRSAVYVMPSVSEPFGISALEAALAGVPQVISRQSGVAEVLHSALVADYWNIDEISAGILRLLKDKTLAAQLSEDGRLEAGALTWSRTAQDLSAVYRSLV